jgi:SAM-dependent methyltransferase
VFFAAVPLGPRPAGKISFFGDGDLDDSLPSANAAFWASLIEHVEDGGVERPSAILDFGCHSGGLLALLGRRFPAAHLFGIEPIDALRADAATRLAGQGAQYTILDGEKWEKVEAGSIDLLVCHEVLYLIPDLGVVMRQVRRVLSAAGQGFIVLGCHAENPVWTTWRRHFDARGVPVYDHRPFDILTAAAEAGLSVQVQPLRRSGWVRYDPLDADFPFPDAQAMFEHHYRHKLIFRVELDDGSASSSP